MSPEVTEVTVKTTFLHNEIKDRKLSNPSYSIITKKIRVYLISVLETTNTPWICVANGSPPTTILIRISEDTRSGHRKNVVV